MCRGLEWQTHSAHDSVFVYSCSEIVVVTDVLEYFMEYGAWEIMYIQLYFTILHGSTK